MARGIVGTNPALSSVEDQCKIVLSAVERMRQRRQVVRLQLAPASFVSLVTLVKIALLSGNVNQEEANIWRARLKSWIGHQCSQETDLAAMLRIGIDGHLLPPGSIEATAIEEAGPARRQDEATDAKGGV